MRNERAKYLIGAAVKMELESILQQHVNTDLPTSVSFLSSITVIFRRESYKLVLVILRLKSLRLGRITVTTKYPLKAHIALPYLKREKT